VQGFFSGFQRGVLLRDQDAVAAVIDAARYPKGGIGAVAVAGGGGGGKGWRVGPSVELTMSKMMKLAQNRKNWKLASLRPWEFHHRPPSNERTESRAASRHSRSPHR